MTPNYLSPSELGNKDYWDATYTHDLTTHATAPNHTGTTWFADARASQKTLAHLLSLTDPPLSRTSTSFLDLGTGNGEMLFLLRSPPASSAPEGDSGTDDDDDDDDAGGGGGGFIGPMLGIDYSPASIELATRLAAQKNYTVPSPSNPHPITFRQHDILTHPWDDQDAFDVVLDKGTFDAVSLSSATHAQGRRACEGYAAKVLPMVKKQGGRFLVTSCNWTEEELRGWFEGKKQGEEEAGFVFEGRVEYPRFRFGGKVGQSVSGVCFRRV